MRGFTLLETIVALAVITAAAVGPVALITSGIFSASFSKNKLVAANLAQEGLELIRLVRENNVLCNALKGGGWSWRKDPAGGNFGQETREADAFNFSNEVDCGGSILKFPYLPSYAGRNLLYDNVSGTYNYNSGIITPFKRKIEIRAPPDPEGRDPGIPADDQMDVTVTVEWSERGSAKNLVLRERLYNWR